MWAPFKPRFTRLGEAWVIRLAFFVSHCAPNIFNRILGGFTPEFNYF